MECKLLSQITSTKADGEKRLQAENKKINLIRCRQASLFPFLSICIHRLQLASLVQNQLIDFAERNKSKDLHNLDARELSLCKIRCMQVALHIPTRRSVSILYWLGCDTLRHCVRFNYLNRIWLTLRIDCISALFEKFVHCKTIISHQMINYSGPYLYSGFLSAGEFRTKFIYNGRGIMAAFT